MLQNTGTMRASSLPSHQEITLMLVTLKTISLNYYIGVSSVNKQHLDCRRQCVQRWYNPFSFRVYRRCYHGAAECLIKWSGLVICHKILAVNVQAYSVFHWYKFQSELVLHIKLQLRIVVFILSLVFLLYSK